MIKKDEDEKSRLLPARTPIPTLSPRTAHARIDVYDMR